MKLHINTDVCIERMEKRVDEFLADYSGVVRCMAGGKELVAAAKRLQTEAKKFRAAQEPAKAGTTNDEEES